MADFDMNMPVMAMPKRKVNLQELFGSITDMTEAEANFIGGIYGPAGHGKTVTSMKLAQAITDPDRNILYAYTGQNWNSLKNHPELMRRPNGNAVKKYPFEDMDSLRDLVAALKMPQVREQTKIDTIVFDEYNTMFDMEVDQITNVRAKQLMDEKRIYKDPDTPEWPDYNTAKAHMVVMMNDIMQMPKMNVIFVCHPRQNRKTFVTEPDFFDKAAQAFIRSLNSLYFLSKEMENGTMKRKIILQGTDQLVAKNRIGGLPDQVGDIQTVVDAYNLWAPARNSNNADQVPVVTTVPPKPEPEVVIEPTKVMEKVTVPASTPSEEPVQATVTFDLDSFLNS